MKERVERQITTLSDIARYLRGITFTNARVLHLKDEILEHNDRVKKLANENRAAKAEPRVLRQGRRLTKDKLREEQLLPLSRRGRKLSRVYPALELTLKVPHKNASTSEIADAAERIADALTPHLSMLIEAKYPRNCLATLRRDAQALRVHAEATEKSRGLLNRSNRELTEELSAARITIDELDVVLRSLDDFASYKIDWSFVNRVVARMGRPSKRRLAARKRSAAKYGLRDE
ncbi:MAG TPA: hypothetical protein VGH98_06430 [Gemmatimonadaceae bacterium]|jgi:chromosome segregation ATPase